MKFANLKAAEAELAKYIPIAQQITGKDITVGRIKVLMSAVGNPQDKLKIIHAAGTSGKTSTCYYIASLLQASGKKVGLTVSPHVDSVTERLQINSQPVSDEEFCRALGGFMDLIKDIKPTPSYFELLVALAYWYFAGQGVEYAVIETGMGGLHDGTNIANRPDKVCVITDIGLDHTHILGNTLEEIAYQKAGIMYPDNEVFIYRQSPSVTKVFEDYAQQQAARLNLLDQAELADRFVADGLNGLPLYQQRNWLLARAVSEYIANNDNWDISREQIEESLAIQVPGRMDRLTVDGKTLVMDGAHNQQKMAAFVHSFRREYPNQKIPVLLALKQGKDYQDVLPLLLPITEQMILTTFNVLQDLPAESIDPAVVATAAKQLGFQQISIIEDPRAALIQLLALPNNLAVVTGSFYLLSCIRPGIRHD